MKPRTIIIVTIQAFICTLILAQSTPPIDSNINTELAHPATKKPAIAPPPPPTRSRPPEQYTQLEAQIAEDIGNKQQQLQRLINDFMAEVRQRHPGYEFKDGSLVAIPDQPKEKAKEEKK